MQAIQRVVRVGVVALLLLVTAVAPVRPSNADPAAPRIPAGPPSTPQAPPAYESQARRVLPEAPLARGLEAPLALRAGEPQPMAPVESYRSREVPPIRPRRAQGSPARAPATCTVTSAADSGPGTLRQCLSNAVMSDTILFDPVAFPPTNPRTISVLSELPWIEVDGLTLDASNAGVILDGSSLTEDMPGIVAVGVMGVSIRGLQIQHFAWGIELWRGARQCTIGGNRAIGAGPTGQGNVISGNKYQGIELQDGATRDNVIIGNLIGTNRAGNAPHANDIGIFLGRGASGNTIGGAHTPGICDGPCNVISGNQDVGVRLQGGGTLGNRILGNFVGTDVSGYATVPNNHGVDISVGASSTQIGGTAPGEGNLISGNKNSGIWISWAETSDNQVLGNMIGTDATGAAALPNYHGLIVAESTNNRIGGAAPGAGNLISGNEGSGIALVAGSGNTVEGNRIGADAGGRRAVSNYHGIVISEASNNTIGGVAPGAGNLISGNTNIGVLIQMTSTLNSLVGNLIGTDVTGNSPLPNGDCGVLVGFGASHNTIGGAGSGSANVISGNGTVGIMIQNENSIGNWVLGNRIGTNREGVRAVPNGADGIAVFYARETIIGGAHTPWVCDGPCNLISGNGGTGVWLGGISSVEGALSRSARSVAGQGNLVCGNFIGTDLAGRSAVPNVSPGVVLASQAVGNRVGGTALGEGNLIGGNQMGGAFVQDAGTTANQISGNRIGTTADGSSALGNGEIGVVILASAYANTVGGSEPGAGNLISGNTDNGVQIQNAPGAGVTDNQVLGNLIGTNWDGSGAIPNSNNGLVLILGPTHTLIEGNVISGNAKDGMEFADAGTMNNTARNNVIGVAADRRSPLPNGRFGMGFWEANHNVIGGGNLIAHNPAAGVALVGASSVGNTITRNSIYGNGDGQITFHDMPAPLAPPPILSALAGAIVSGSACPGCRVEVFANAIPGAAGQTYLGTVVAQADGGFAFTAGPGHAYLSATATDAEGTTSPFSTGLLVGYACRLPAVLARRGATSTPTATRILTQPPALTPTSPPTPSPTPTASHTSRGIYGRVTYNGAGIVNVRLALLLSDGSTSSVQATTVSGAGGAYAFGAVPGLGLGQVYYVRYLNGRGGNPDNPNYLAAWFGPDITSYGAGSDLPGGDAELADVTLVAPSDGASVTLPATFSWTRRSTTNDSYRLLHYDPTRDATTATGQLGYVGQVIVTGLPADWPSGVRCQWWVQVYPAGVTDSFGVSYASRSVTVFHSNTEADAGQGVAAADSTPRDKTFHIGEVR